MLIIICCGVDPLGFILFGTLCFLDLGVYFPLRLEEFSFIISLNKFSVSLFPPLLFLLLLLGRHLLQRALIMQMFVPLMLSKKSLNVSSFLKIIFSFSVQLVCFPLPCLPYCWFILLHPLIYLIPSYVFFISVIIFISSNWFSLIFSLSLLKVSLNSSTLFPSSVGIFMIINLNSLSGIIAYLCFI